MNVFSCFITSKNISSVRPCRRAIHIQTDCKGKDFFSNLQIFSQKNLKNFSTARIFQNLLQSCFLDCGCKGSYFFETSKSFFKNFLGTFCTTFCISQIMSILALLCAKFLNICLTLGFEINPRVERRTGLTVPSAAPQHLP